MKSSGMKRGLAVSAVSALAFAGLALTPASAQTIAGSGEPLQLYSQFTAQATTQGTVTLLAGTRNPDGPNVNHMQFSFSPDGVTWTQIGGNFVPVDGVATTEWAAPAGTWNIRVQSFDNGNNVIDTDIQPGVVVGANRPEIDFSNALFAQVGQWDNEIVVSGTTSVGTDIVGLTSRGPESVNGPNGAAISGNTFKGVLPLGTNNTGDATDQVVIGASAFDFEGPATSSDDTSVVTVYNQVVTNVTKTLAPGSSDNVQGGPPNENTTYVLKATDQNGNVIQGVNFYEANSAGAPAAGNGAPDNGETDVNGEALVTLNEADIDAGADQDPAANTQLTHYVVDVNQNGTYENGVDYLFDARQTRYIPSATTVTIENELGKVMDDEEVSEVTIDVDDQNGNPLAGAQVFFKVNRAGHTPAADTPGTYADPDPTNPGPNPVSPQVTNAQGKVTFDFGAHVSETEVVTIDAYVNKDGNPNPTPGDAIATPYVIDTDSSVVNWDEGDLDQVPVGSTTTFTGTWVQENTGKPLPNRPLDIDYTSGLGAPGNSILAPQAQQPAGTTRGNDFEAVAVTNANGEFGVAVSDPTPPDGQELDALLSAEGQPLPNGLDAENDPADLEIDFIRSFDVTDVEIRNFSNDNLGSLWSPFAGNDDLQPGKLGLGYVLAYNADGVLLEDTDVPMTINEGNFVNLNNLFDPTPVEGNLAGEWSNAGKNITLNTGDEGDENAFIINIERHAGFDDNGEVDDEVTAGTGSASYEHDFEWNTMDVPLNSGSYTVELSEEQESSVLPKARAGDVPFPFDGTFTDGVGQLVDYDVIATDQFGNRTGQSITVSDNSAVADFTVATGRTQFTLEGPAITANSPAEALQALEVELDNQTTSVYQDNPFTGGFDPANPLNFTNLFTMPTADIEQETNEIEWYEVDYDASTFTLGQDGPETVPVQSAVTEVLTGTDQEGQPLENLFVDFLRGGPGNEDDDSCNEDVLNNCLVTDINGEAFYDFVGGSAGTATVTAVVYSPEGVRVETVGPDTVTFKGATERQPIVAKLKGSNAGNKDLLMVKAPTIAAGATVKLQKKTANGWKTIGTKNLNSVGDRTFSVKDKNGNKVTKYRAKVSQTVDTLADVTNVVRQK